MPGIDESLLDAMRLPGARGASVVDWISGLALGAVGEAPGGDGEVAAAETAELARLAAESGAFRRATAGDAAEPGKEPPVQDVIITTPDDYHVIRFVVTPFDSSVALHLWLGRAEGNLALARIRLAELAQRLVLG
ncbi:hypothetical protein [Streptomyces sp. B93]|uniref:hypothetical protein n=1 Tax=Streptomyces sp. B93 TaxID=2824875 RepID=UPI001B38E0FF|nr:hypothetical protein [Streptomyces sp. B93]MBQ1088289.1 hypothetical protein [Streptomyces sp. B93]